MKYPLGTKLYYSISEVAELAQLPPYTLRAWEKEFSWLKPRRVSGKNRAYRQRDVSIVLLIKRLICEERFTIEGARQKLKNDPELIRQAVEQAEWVRQRGETPVSEPDEETGTEEVEQTHVGEQTAATPLSAGNTVWHPVLEDVRKELREILGILS